ncbi:hypothetical protein K435DRAFT_783988 [Dendrothele bispora CBS 962.96]|uniref:Uncharacterized protein n=1 Tax=Dendrothele bispora (strain CBS 962.96) TaxID=1314807 RepID=A0A4S8L6B8_DENBC|nr:hypothetical protein K435DRAFT_783988 [Dendrothele bispora CBS 962.96]
MNINDSAGLSALLDRLRSSQAWQQAISQPQSPLATSTPEVPRPNDTSDSRANSQADWGTAAKSRDSDSSDKPNAGPDVNRSSSASGTRSMTSWNDDVSNGTTASPPQSNSAVSNSSNSTVASLLSQLQSDSSVTPLSPNPSSNDRHSIHRTRGLGNSASTHLGPGTRTDAGLGRDTVGTWSSASSNNIQESTQTQSVSSVYLGHDFDVHTPKSASTSTPTHGIGLESSPSSISTPLPNSQERSRFTFQQVLPVVARLSEDRDFVKALTSMKKEQEVLERRLWEERTSILKKYEDKVKTAMTKATMTGATGLSKHESTMLSDACKKELRRFDTERALVLWDGLISQQQEHLARLGVPTMFVTDGQSDRETQQKVMQVLEGLV